MKRAGDHADTVKTVKTGFSKWTVWRQDDNGNQFVIENNLSEVEAKKIVKPGLCNRSSRSLGYFDRNLLFIKEEYP